MVDFGEGTGGKGEFIEGMRYFRRKKPLNGRGAENFSNICGLTYCSQSRYVHSRHI